MNREEIIAKVAHFTNIDTTEATQVCQDHIDTIQDNDICGAYDFSFLKDYSEITTAPTYTTGTVSITQDSTSATGSGTSWLTATHTGRIIKFNSDSEYYEITAIVDGTQVMTLSSAYIGDTDTDATYNMYKIYYDLPTDFKKMVWAKQIDTPDVILPLREITTVNAYTDEFDYSGNIQAYILSGLNSSGTPQVRFYPMQTTRKKVHICYIKKLPTINSTGATSKIPSSVHMLFVYKLNEIIFDMHSMPNRAAKEAVKFNNMLQAFIKEDKSITRDSIDTMQSAFLNQTMAHPVLTPSHYNNYGK